MDLEDGEREALSRLWQLGFLTADQLARLRRGGCTVRWAEEVLAKLYRRDLVWRTRRHPSWAPRIRGPRPYAHYLSERGIPIVGRINGGLTPGGARKAYGRVCREDLFDHALLCSEYLARLAVAVREHKDGLVLGHVRGERDAWRWVYPSRKKSLGSYADGGAVVHKAGHPDFRLTVLVEAHTGSEDNSRVMSQKVEGYCKERGVIFDHVRAGRPKEVRMCVVFVAPTERLAQQARRLCAGVEGMVYSDYLKLRRSPRSGEDPAELFLFASLEGIGETKALHNVYTPLGDPSALRSPLWRM